jgi:hypothetical protein
VDLTRAECADGRDIRKEYVAKVVKRNDKEPQKRPPHPHHLYIGLLKAAYTSS